jgi:hypothetical protein
MVFMQIHSTHRIRKTITRKKERQAISLKSIEQQGIKLPMDFKTTKKEVESKDLQIAKVYSHSL